MSNNIKMKKDETTTTKRNNQKKKVVPDGYKPGPPEGGFGWVVLVAVFLVTVMMSVPGTAFGILLQDIIVTMGTTTAVAAWGASISMSTSNFISPLVTIAIHNFSSRKTAFFGGIALSCGLIFSYFCNTIYSLILVYGILTGIGYGFCRISCLVLASHYFQKRYNIAASVIYTGFSVGRLIFSPLVQLTNEICGFRGTFLLMGGIAANILVGAALFQPAKWHYILHKIQQTDEDEMMIEEREPENSNHKKIVNDTMKYENEDNKIILYEEHPENRNTSVQLKYYKTITEPLNVEAAALNNHTDNGTQKDKQVAYLKEEEVMFLKNDTNNAKNQAETKKESWKTKLNKSLDFSLLKESVFYVILASQVLTYLSLMYGIVFLVPLGIDKGLTPMQAAIVPTFRAFAEILGRMGFPFVQSICKMDPIVFYILTCTVAGFAFMAQALAEGYGLILTTALITGFLTGGTVVQNTTITLYSVGPKKLPSTLGLCSFFQGFFILVGGPLIGWVRDTTGSLVKGYLLITAFQGACALVWIFRYISLKRNNKSGAAET